MRRKPVKVVVERWPSRPMSDAELMAEREKLVTLLAESLAAVQRRQARKG